MNKNKLFLNDMFNRIYRLCNLFWKLLITITFLHYSNNFYFSDFSKIVIVISGMYWASYPFIKFLWSNK
ncbi:MAG: hypothetical protein ACOC56_02070 [Atribacterota bacterium]